MNLLFLDDERFPDEVFWIPAKYYSTCTAIQMVRTSEVFYEKVTWVQLHTSYMPALLALLRRY